MDKILILLACIFACSHAINWKDCGSTKGKIKSVAVGNCPTAPGKDPCPMKKGTNATFTVDFTPNEDAAKARSVVHGIVAGVPVPFPLPNPDGCKDSGLTCPLKKDMAVSFKQSIPIKSSYPSIKLVVKWELQDENGDDLFCLEVLAQVE